MMIKEEFLSTLRHYTPDPKVHQSLWQEIEKDYSKSDRHYHNLDHLQALLDELSSMKSKFAHWDTIIFAIAYHDIVYNTLKSSNEEKSAALAANRLRSIAFPANQITVCANLILATKKHESADRETNLFTDADLSILGADPATYKVYAQHIRQEYSVYPDFMYNPGRKKVLTHFLLMPRIYKSDEFAGKYEEKARTNLQKELDDLR